MRVMYDAVNVLGPPPGAALYAGYVDGLYRSFDGLVARFPDALHVAIATQPSTVDTPVIDLETGDFDVPQAVAGVVARRARLIIPTVYVELSRWDEARNGFHGAGVPEPLWWVAAAPGNGANLYPGSVAHQYGTPGDYDVSVVADHWPGIDKEGKKPMGFLAKDPNQAAVVMIDVDLGTATWVAAPETETALQYVRGAGGLDPTVHPVSAPQWRGLQWLGPRAPGW